MKAAIHAVAFVSFTCLTFANDARCHEPAADKLPPGVVRRLGTESLRQGYCQSAAFSPDGTILATGGMDIRLWDLKTRRLLRVMTMPDRQIDGDAVHMEFTSDGKTLYVQGGGPGQVSTFDITSGKRVHRLESFSPFAVSADGKVLATGGGAKGEVVLWDTATRKQLQTLMGHERFNPGPKNDARRLDVYVQSVGFSPDGKWLASMALYDEWIRIFDAATGKLKHNLDCQAIHGTRLAVSPEGHVAAYRRPSPEAKQKPAIVVWDMATGKVEREYAWAPAWGPGYHGLVFSPDGKWLAGDGGNRALAVWDRNTAKKRFLDPHPTWPYTCLAFSKDGDTLVACNGGLEIWDLKTQRSLVADEGHTAMIQALDLTADGATAASSDGLNVRLWDVKAGKERRRIHDAVGASSLAFSPNGRILATHAFSAAASECSACLWDTATGKEVRRFKLPAEQGRVAFSPNGKTLAVSSGNNLTVRFFDVESGKEVRRLVGNRGNDFGMYPFPFRLSPDGKHFASLLRGDGDVAVALWNLSDKREPTIVSLEGGNIYDIAFSPDGEYLAWSDSHDVHLWDVRENKRLTTLKKASGHILIFTPDGRYIAAGKKLHPVNGKGPTLELPMHPNMLAFSRDGSVAVAVQNYEASLLVLDTRKLIK